jgi:carboxyl-terminal processing protease
MPEEQLMWAASCVEKRVRFAIGFSFCWFVIAVWHAPATLAGDNKNMSFGQRDAAEECLKKVYHEVEDRYYDASFHGIDLKARAKEAKDRIAKVHTLSEVYSVIAWMLDGLDDSHTFFLPPLRPYDVQHGWEFGFVGDNCYIIAVQPDSDAFKQGIKPGDELISLEGFAVTRENFWKLQYAFEGLAPRSGMNMTLRSPGGKTHTTLVNAKVVKLPKQLDIFGPGEWFRSKELGRLWEPRVVEMGDELMIWKLPQFNIDEGEIDKYIRLARKHRGLILDLRGNPGGGELVLSRLLASVFDRDVILGDKIQRHQTKPWKVKSRGAVSTYSGKLLVLIDSQSASAAEIFARVTQIEKRALVIGDRSAGMVMESRHSFFSAGQFDPIVAGVSVTEADLRMTDGKSLERVGVNPDKVVLPKPEDLAANRDPTLAVAAAELGVQLTPEQAGKLFPTRWRAN